MKKKLQSSQGETLVEVLASILIGSLSIALLFSAVMASVSIDQTAQAADEAYYEALTRAERQSSSDICASCPGTTIEVSGQTLNVSLYGTDQLLAYTLAPSAPESGGGG